MTPRMRRLAHALILFLAAACMALVEDNSGNRSDYLLLCTADGRVFSVHAWTGDVQKEQVIQTDPLIGRSTVPTSLARRRGEDDDDDDEDGPENQEYDGDDDDDDEDSMNIILPGLDGRLYWQQQDGHLEALQLEISSLLEQPVKSCPDEGDSQNCGILTATVETSLMAFNADGKVQWYDKAHQSTVTFSSSGDVSNLPSSTSVNKDEPVLLLQRRDYHVKHVRSSTGLQAWNISLGLWQALDFGSGQPVDLAIDDDDNDDEDEFVWQTLPVGHGIDSSKRREKDMKEKRLNHKKEQQQIRLNAPVLPAIVFQNQGQTLIAVDLVSMRVLWTMDTPSVVASVFGMQGGQWKPVQVLQEQDLTNTKKHTPALAIDDHAASERDEETQRYYDYALQDWFYSRTTNPYSNAYLQHRSSEHSMRPSGIKPKFPRRNAPEYNVCMPGDDCRNIPEIKRFLPLLPSPPPRVQPEGLYLSWRLVGGLLTTFVAIAGFAGHYWYLRKKQKWLEDMQLQNEIVMSAGDGQIVPSSSDNEVAKGSAVALPDALTRQLSDRNCPFSDEEKVDADSTNAAPVTMTAIGGIPLVRYSRYATEFEELEALGKGGFGTVWRVRNLFDGRHYAMKKVFIHGTVGDPQFQQRLERTLREVKILAALDHPNIVRYYNAWLELEKDNGEEIRTLDTSTIDESSAAITRCYSSSMLMSDSVSQWPSLYQGRNRPSHAGLSSPLRKSVVWRPKAMDDASDFLNFESQSNDIDKESKVDSSQSADQPSSVQRNSATATRTFDEKVLLKEATPPETALSANEKVRHTLYIQMQLCTQKTIGDLLTNMTARQGFVSNGVDVPQALKLFQQIAQAVTYVHTQGLIHRDLKPANCFVDEGGNVQVGDFGLSRESSGGIVHKSGSFQRASTLEHGIVSIENLDHTAGVGTRSYASPEQMNGSDYASSTDIYSLGVLLFELVYPMHTGMERNICLTQLRKSQFPNDFDILVGNAFPTLGPLLLSMLSEKPSKRPTASSIVSHIKTILSEYSILSLDESQHQGPDMLLLRIEAEHCADALTLAIDAIHEAANTLSEPVEIVQYGLRSSSDGDKPAAIIELAIKFKDGDGSVLVSELQKRPSMYSVRQVRSRSESTLSN